MHYAAEITGKAIQSQRECYSAVCRTFAEPYPPWVSSSDFQIDSGGYDLKLRRYKNNRHSANHPGKTAIVYYHGGGFMLGDLASHDSICAEICDHTAFDVISVDYRLAPEFQYPDDLDDALSAFRCAADRYEQVMVAGDSAGANLAAAVCICLRDATSGDTRQCPIGQLLTYPALGGCELNLQSYTTHANAPLLTTENVLCLPLYTRRQSLCPHGAAILSLAAG